MIGTSIIATGAYHCSETMAAYQTRNQSRFQYSHEFAHVNLTDFCDKDIQDFTIGSDTDGAPFIKSNVAKHLYTDPNNSKKDVSTTKY